MAKKLAERCNAVGSADALRRITTAIGELEMVVSEWAISGTDLSDTCEMLRVWQALAHASDRRKVLALAYDLAKWE